MNTESHMSGSGGASDHPQFDRASSDHSASDNPSSDNPQFDQSPSNNSPSINPSPDEAIIPADARLVFLVGPTAVGKTSVALDMAEATGGEIVSLDSRQMLRRLDIGTAKPSAAERARVRHHLVDVVDPLSPWPLSRVVAEARRAVADIHARGRVPILVGGTGQYLWAMVEGWRIPEAEPDPELRARLYEVAEREGHAALHERLRAVDPASADQVDARNVRRVVRALEIHAVTGHPKSELAAKQGAPCPLRILGLSRSRPALYARIDRRIERMLADGLEAEVRALVASGLSIDLPAMSSLGYREWRPLLAGEGTREDVAAAIRANTRRLVRTQTNWFAPDDARITWFDLEVVAVDEPVQAARDFLAGEADAQSRSPTSRVEGV